MYNVFADAVVVAHFLFIVFIIFGGLLVIRWPRTFLVQMPAALWGAAVEIFAWNCPLTPLENHFRNLAGSSLYSGDFIARYLLFVIYPEYLTTATQYIFGGLVIFINVIFYTIAICKQRSTQTPAI